MKGLKTVYICSECEYTSPKWLGKCPKCGAWNSFVEDVVSLEPQATAKKRVLADFGSSEVRPFSELDIPEYRVPCRTKEEIEQEAQGAFG